MRQMCKPISKAMLLAMVVVFCACTATRADHSYVTDYQVIGDRSVKYIYLPSEKSRAGQSYLDQGLALEICSIDEDDEGAYETDCRQTRILKTEEFR